MKYPLNLSSIYFLFTFFTLALFGCQNQKLDVDSYDTELLQSWNKIIIDMAIEEDGLMSLKGVRTEALMHLAIHNSLNAIEPLYTFYAFEGNEPDANPIAAAAQAAYEIGISQFPKNAEKLEQELEKWLSPIDEGRAKLKGIELGKRAAAKVLEDRSDDQWNGASDYTWHPMAPGVYAEFNTHSGTPEGFIFGAGWAAAQPFALDSQDQFRAPPPPAISSEAYTQAFNEVKEYGSTESELRSQDQAHLALWWKDFVENSHNRLARNLVEKEGLNLWEGARLFGLLNMAIYDAYVNVFDNKFHYNHWRPYTAIRWAANDENPNTEPDIEWNNLHKHTYAFPSYPSAHGTASTSAMMILANALGRGDEYAFTMKTEEVDQAGPFSGKIKMDPPTRSFGSFTEAGLEASMSRVYLGIHFRYDSEEGHQLGKKVGEYVAQKYLVPLEDKE